MTDTLLYDLCSDPDLVKPGTVQTDPAQDIKNPLQDMKPDDEVDG